MIFVEKPWKLREVLKKVYVSHDEFLEQFPHHELDIALARLTARWSPPPIGMVKINVDGSFLEGVPRIGVGGILRDHLGG